MRLRSILYVVSFILKINIMVGCAQPQERNNTDILSMSPGPEIIDNPVINSEDKEKIIQRDSIFIDTIPKEIWLKEFEKAQDNNLNDTYNLNIYTTYGELPDGMKPQIIANETLLQKKIATSCWEGYIKESFDSGKLSHRSYADTTYYELARKLMIDITNIETGKHLKTEVSRENITKEKDEIYAQYNLCSWDIEKTTPEYLEVTCVITLLDSDIGDEVTIRITKDGKYSIQNKSTLETMD